MNIKYRPMAIMGFSSLLILLLCVSISGKFAYISIAVGLIILFCSLIIKSVKIKIFPFFIAAAMIFSGLIYSASDLFDISYAQRFTGGSHIINGTIIDEPYTKNSRTYYIIKLKNIDDYDIDVKLRLSLPEEIEAKPYSDISLKANVYSIGEKNTDVKNYFYSKGIFLGAYADNGVDFCVNTKENSNNQPLGYKMLVLRKVIRERIFNKLPNEYGSVIIGMLTGDKTTMTDEMTDSFAKAGVSHLFAVSGMHLSVWIMGLYSLFEIFKVKKRFNSLIGIASTVLFMFFTGFTPSVCRAGIMLIIMLVGNLFYRRQDSINSLGFAVLIMTFLNPLIVADIGFLLSVCSTLGIVVIYPVVNENLLKRLNGFFGMILKAVLSIILLSVSATIGSLPITVFFIGSVSVYGVLTNLLITYASTLCMICGGFGVITFPTMISDAFVYISGCLAKYILYIVNFVCELPNARISTEDIFWKSGIILSLAVIAFAFLNFENKLRYRVLSLGLCITIIGSTVCSCIYYDGLTKIDIVKGYDTVGAVISHEGKKVAIFPETRDRYLSTDMCGALNKISRKPCDLLIAPYGADESSANTVYFICDYKFERIITPISGQSAESLVPAESITITNDIYVKLWENSFAQFVKDDSVSFVYCEFDGVSVLFLFDGNAKDIIYKYKSSDFFAGNKNDSLKIDKIIDCKNVENNLTVEIRNGDYKTYVKEG